MRVTEIFRTLQGEGARAGAPSIFVRFSGCSAKYACAQGGVVCDTEFESGHEWSVDGLIGHVEEIAAGIQWIVWTGGEPADQLTNDLVAAVALRGFKQQIETSGVRPVPEGLDWITVSPKVAEHILVRHFPIRHDGTHVDELKYVRHRGQAIPEPALVAARYWLSPHADGETLPMENIRHCVNLCLDHPRWALSLQQHKLWHVR